MILQSPIIMLFSILNFWLFNSLNIIFTKKEHHLQHLMGLVDKKWKKIYPRSKLMLQTNMNHGINLVSLFNLDRLINQFNNKYQKRAEFIVCIFITCLSLIYAYFGVQIILLKQKITDIGGYKFFCETMFLFYMYSGILLISMIKGSQVNMIDK